MFLVDIYRDLEQLETQMLDGTNLNLSISEIHMLEAVQRVSEGGGVTISKLSEHLGISLPSVTLSINKLEKKGYVTKQKHEKDGRVVLVEFTKQGRKAERAHRYFHRSMVREVTELMTDDEKDALMHGIAKLDTFLKSKIQER